MPLYDDLNDFYADPPRAGNPSFFGTREAAVVSILREANVPVHEADFAAYLGLPLWKATQLLREMRNRGILDAFPDGTWGLAEWQVSGPYAQNPRGRKRYFYAVKPHGEAWEVWHVASPLDLPYQPAEIETISFAFNSRRSLLQRWPEASAALVYPDEAAKENPISGGHHVSSRPRRGRSKQVPLEALESIGGMDKALKDYVKFHGNEPKNAKKWTLPGKGGKKVQLKGVVLGDVPEVHYNGPDHSESKKNVHWVHKTKRNRMPKLVWLPEYKAFMIVGGAMTMRRSKGDDVGWLHD